MDRGRRRPGVQGSGFGATAASRAKGDWRAWRRGIQDIIAFRAMITEIGPPIIIRIIFRNILLNWAIIAGIPNSINIRIFL